MTEAREESLLSTSRQDSSPSTTRNESNTLSDYGTAAEAKAFITNPVQDLIETKDAFLSVADFWHDMKMRERTNYHKATLIVGSVLALSVAVYAILLRVSPKGKLEPTYTSYSASILGAAAIAQLFFSYLGICLENSPMLLLANVNACGLSIKLALSINSSLVSTSIVAVFLILTTVLTMLHMVISFYAWGGEFTRYIAFVIGTEPSIQLLYRQYQLMIAVAFMDLEFLFMACVTIFFFLEDGYVGTSIIVVSIFLISIAARSALRRGVKKEKSWLLFALVPIVLAVPVMLGVILYSSSVMSIVVDIPQSCKYTTLFILVWFSVIRLSLLICIFNCRRNFGSGLKDAFQKERTVRGYFAQRKARTLGAFLSKAGSHA